MANRLAIVAIAATLAAATITAHAAGMPDTGTKNFVPSGDAPAYLTNENLAVAPGSAGQSPLGTEFNQAPGPERAVAPHATETRTLAAHRGGVHRAAADTRSKARSRRVASNRTVRDGRSASLGRNTRPVRTGSRTASAARPRIARPGTARPGTARHGKANVRHASAKSAARRG